MSNNTQHQTSLNNFVVIKKLGEGSFSQVLKVRRKSDGVNYALKKVTLGKLTSKEKENALNEIRILASINHPNVIGYKEAFLEDNNRTLCIVMELAEGGDLLQLVDKHKKKMTNIPEKDLWHYFIQIVHGLKALHDLKICHRDIKGANLFLTSDGTVKLGDLNVSKIAKAGMMHTQTGTPYYASPEVWKDKPYDHRSDIWSLGCVLYEMATKQPPFKAATMDGLYQKVVKGNFVPLGRQFSLELNQVIKDCLQVNHRQRPNCEQILKSPGVLKHTSKDLQEFAQDQLSNTENEDLLGTIKLPRNLNLIQSRLPEAQYDKPTLKRTNSMPVTPELSTDMSSNYSKLSGRNSKQQQASMVQQSPRESENLIQQAHKLHDRVQRKALDTIREDQTAKEDDDVFNLAKKPPQARHQQKRIQHPKVLCDVYKSNPKSVQVDMNLKAQKENLLSQNHAVHDTKTPQIIAAKANRLPELKVYDSQKPQVHIIPASAIGSNRKHYNNRQGEDGLLPKLVDMSVVQKEQSRLRPHSMNRPLPYNREMSHRSQLSSQEHINRIRKQIVSRELQQINNQQKDNQYSRLDQASDNYSQYEQRRIEMRRGDDGYINSKNRPYYRNQSSRPDILSHRSYAISDTNKSHQLSSAVIGLHHRNNSNQQVPISMPSSRAGGNLSKVARLIF